MSAKDKISLWLFFVEYWDDYIIGFGDQPVTIDARTMRVLETIFGKSTVKQHLDFWIKEGDVKILGNSHELKATTPCVEVLNYLNELPPEVAS